MEYPYFKGLEADRYSFYRVPKALVKADLFQKMSGDAKLLYAVLLDRMSLSIKNGWQDKHGNAYIICTIEEVMDSIHCARQKAVKLLDELEHEFQLIERRRQGLCKPNLLYVKDLYAGLSQSNYWKYENHTSGGMKNELPGVPKSNGSNTEKINKTDNSETDLIYPAELQEEEQYRRYFKEALELEILEQGYPADKAVLYEILELLVETVTSRKKFLRICGEDKPKEVVKSRLMKLDSSHIQYILECLKENSTQMPYVWGGSSPSTSFDCSGFVCWVINNCGNGWSVGRTTANGLRGKCSYVSPADAQPGDLIFFEKTYNTAGASHVGIYVGNGMMIHCGDPISYTSINSTYWQSHFLGFGRIN